MEEHELVWCQENGRPIDLHADWQDWSDILAEAGIGHAGSHAMRHSAATIAIHQGVALPVVEEMLGHSDIRVTRGYVDVSLPLAQDAAARVGRALFGVTVPKESPQRPTWAAFLLAEKRREIKAIEYKRDKGTEPGRVTRSPPGPDAQDIPVRRPDEE